MPATDDAPPLPFSLPSISGKKITAAFDGGRISSDGGVLLLAGVDKRLGLIDTLAALIPDYRDPSLRHRDDNCIASKTEHQSLALGF